MDTEFTRREELRDNETRSEWRMILTLEIPTELGAGLLAQANAAGVSLEAYVKQRLQSIAITKPSETCTGQSRQEAVRSMLEFGEKYCLSLGEPITRKLMHEGHRF